MYYTAHIYHRPNVIEYSFFGQEEYNKNDIACSWKSILSEHKATDYAPVFLCL